MPGTQVRQIRKTVQVDGVNKYSITAIAAVPGDLPDTHIFLMAINTTVDPKDDTLQRVVQPADFAEYKLDRDAAILAGDAFWRAPTLTLTYDDIETADAAWKELSTRISSLVVSFDTFNDSFETPATGTVTTYPVVDASLKAQLIDAYSVSKTTVAAKEKDRDEHIDDCEKLKFELETIEERLAEAKSDLTSVVSIDAELAGSVIRLSSVNSSISADRDAIRTLNSASSASLSEKDGIETELRGMDAQLNVFDLEETSLGTLSSGQVGTLVASLQSRVTTLSTDRNTKTIELNKCEATLASIQGALDAARATRDAALAAVLDACPDFDPASA